MTLNNPYKMYKQNSVTTASPGELTIMLYNGCLKFISIAKEAIGSNSYDVRNKNIQKAQNIIRELMITLNMDYEISKNMYALYEYMNRRLIEANIKNDLKVLVEVEEMVIEFRDTWKQVIQENRKKNYQGDVV